MLLIDLAILVGVAAGLVLVTSAIGGQTLGRRLEKRKREKQGERNAEEERRRIAERCSVCDLPIDPAVDLFERGAWWHRGCWRESVE